jgi:hypothetical protein
MRDRKRSPVTGSTRTDPVSLVAGLVLVAFGTVLLLDQLDVIDLRFAAVGPIVCAAIGAILLAAGLGRRA